MSAQTHNFLHDGALEGEFAVASQTVFNDALKSRPTPNFLFIHYPGAATSWEVATEGLAEPTWLPTLVREAILAGQNGTRTIKKDEVPERAYKGMIDNAQNRDGVVIPRDRMIGGLPTYVKFLPCRHPQTGRAGRFHFEAWQTVIPPRKGKRVKPKMNMAMFNRWRLALVEDGIVPSMREQDLLDEIRVVRTHLARREADTGLNETARNAAINKRRVVVELYEGAVIPIKGGLTLDTSEILKRVEPPTPVLDENEVDWFPGLNNSAQRKLFRAGYKTVEAVIAADLADLVAIDGIGPGTVKKIQKALAALPTNIEPSEVN